tara:strand:+ start:275 stop:673 length:399 start_codon:yes stop_codon:yes gene_type:complete
VDQVTKVVLIRQKETQVEQDAYQVNLKPQQVVVDMRQQVVIHQLQTLGVQEEQVQILVQVFQEHQTVEHMQVVEVEVLEVLQVQLVLVELVVEEMQVVEHNQEEMLQQILVVAVEEHYNQLLQYKVVMVAQE